MIKNLLFICLTIFKFYSQAQNFVASYGFADVTTSSGIIDPSSTPTVTGLSCGSFSARGTSANPSATGRFSFTGWPLGGINGTDDYSNFTGALSPTVYYEVTLTPDPGYTLSLSSATFTIRRSSTGTRQYCIRTDQDNYINNLAAGTGTNTKLSVIPGDIFFWNYDSVSATSDQRGSEIVFGNSFKSITNPVTLRIYAWNAESSGGSFAIDNFSFLGSIINSVSTVGIPSQKINAEFKFYPNPATDGKFTLENAEDLHGIKIYSSSGELLFSKDFEQSGSTKQLDLSFPGTGIYILRLYLKDWDFLEKRILIQK